MPRPLKPVKRYLSDPLARDLKKKILIVTGPRQCGKTTLAKGLKPSFDYLNYDERDHHKTFPNLVEIRKALPWLSKMNF